MTDHPEKVGKLVIISGPSGVGKSTICSRIVDRLDAVLSVSATTRPQAAAEKEGVNYYFLTREEFKERIGQDAFLEYAEVFGNYYGTPRQPVDAARQAGHVVILEIDVQGALQVKKQCPEAVTIFILPPRTDVLQARMEGRGRGEDAQSKKNRLQTASHEIAAAWQYYDHMVVNDNLEQAMQEVIALIEE